MIDPLHLAAALDFLGEAHPPRVTLTPTDPMRRRYMLEDTAGALEYFAGSAWALKKPAGRAALEVFQLAAAVWREYLHTFAANFEPDAAALNLHAWAAVWGGTCTEPRPLPLPDLLAQSFP
ncbi:hypothetical protein [Deinococcus sp.]|uniref:hypothetical protein n=1 Tax=Deinococcus sp. TaxID=47478 RepID=UPI003C7AA6CF